MPRRSLLAALALLAAPAGAHAAPACTAGRTLFISGSLRIFAVTFRDVSSWGTEQYACLGRRGRALHVGITYDDIGVGTDDTPAYVYDGRRFLASLHTSDSEGGPDARYERFDLRRRRFLSSQNVPFATPLPTFRLAGGGRLVHRRQVAVRGRTEYWRTRSGEVVTRRLPGPPAHENRVLTPVRAMVRTDACALAAGRTVAASPRVRVLARDGRRFVCRHRGRGLHHVPGEARVSIVHDRWLLLRRPGRASMRDTRTGRAVRARNARHAWALQDGTLVWTTPSGALRAGRATLAPHASGVAISGRTVYWRAGGAAHAWPTR